MALLPAGIVLEGSKLDSGQYSQKKAVRGPQWVWAGVAGARIGAAPEGRKEELCRMGWPPSFCSFFVSLLKISISGSEASDTMHETA